MSNSASAKPERGLVVGARYRLESILGEGGMAVVWKATHTETDRKVALKLVRAELVRSELVREMFVREARVGARIGRNDHIVDVLDAGVDETLKVPFIAMELLEGQSLDNIIRNGPMPAALVADLLEQLADALDQAHGAGVFHRDLKPQNLFLTTDRKNKPLLKVVDFGIAKLSESTMQSATHVGTPAYGAPEQLGESWRSIAKGRGKTIATQVSAATDVWALGLIAFEMLTGAQPGLFWGAETLAELPVKIVLEPLPRAAARVDPALVPPAFDVWIAQCLALDAAARWPSAKAAVDALTPSLRAFTQPEGTVLAPPQQPPQRPGSQPQYAPQQQPQSPQQQPQQPPPQRPPPQPMIPTGPPFASPLQPPHPPHPQHPQQGHLIGPPVGTAPPGMQQRWPQPPPTHHGAMTSPPMVAPGQDPLLAQWIARWRADLRVPGDPRSLQTLPMMFMPRATHIAREVRVQLPNAGAVAIFSDVVMSDAIRQAMGEDRMLLGTIQAPRLAFRAAVRSKRSSGGLVDGMARGLKALDALVSAPQRNMLGDPHFEALFEVYASGSHEAQAALPISLRQVLMTGGFGNQPNVGGFGQASFHGILERFPGTLLVTMFHWRFGPTDLDRMIDLANRLLGAIP